MGAVCWWVVSDKEMILIGQWNDTGPVIGSWCLVLRVWLSQLCYDKSWRRPEPGSGHMTETLCHTDIVWHVTNAWPRHTSHSMSHSPFLFVLTKMFTHWLTTASWFLMRTLYFSCTPNNMIKRSIIALISLKHVIFRDTHGRDHEIKTLFRKLSGSW